MEKCIYCGEDSEYTTLIRKPSAFIADDTYVPLINADEWICLECLDFEIGEIKP